MLDQSAASKIFGIEMPASTAAKVLAPLIECALKMEGLIPALDRMVLIHLAMVALDARPCGFVYDKKTAASSAESEPLIFCVLSTYCCNVRAGHCSCLFGKAGKKYSLIGLPVWHCLGGANRAIIAPS